MPDPYNPGPPTPMPQVPREKGFGERLLDLWHMATMPAPYGKPMGAPAAAFVGPLDPGGILGTQSVRPREEAIAVPPSPAPQIPTSPTPIEMPYIPRTSEGVLQDLQNYAPVFARPGRVQPVDRTRTNLGLELGQVAAEEGAKAAKDEAYWNTAEQQDLGAVADKRGKIYEEGAAAQAERRKAVNEAVARGQKKIDADLDYVRNNPVDPYKSFRPHTPAGALALLGSALMATGAAFRRDNSLDWTKQLDTMLERESQQQLRMLENKKWAATEEGRNVQRILDTSRDTEEAAMRLQAQKLGVLAERAAAITANAKGEQFKARGKKAVADLHEKLADKVLNIGIREQALESQENQATLSAQTQTALGNLGFAGTVVQAGATEAAAKRHADYQRSLPVLTRLQELSNKYENAHAALLNFWQVLRDPQATDAAKNQAYAEQVAAYSDFMGGGKQAGVRDTIAAFGWPTSFQEFVNKMNKKPTAIDQQSALRRLDQAYWDMTEHVKSGRWVTPSPPWGSSYSVPKK